MLYCTRLVLTLSVCVTPGPGIQGRGYRQVEDQKGRWQIYVMKGERGDRPDCGSVQYSLNAISRIDLENRGIGRPEQGSS
jgi:hypothetical protein